MRPTIPASRFPKTVQSRERELVHGAYVGADSFRPGSRRLEDQEDYLDDDLNDADLLAADMMTNSVNVGDFSEIPQEGFIPFESAAVQLGSGQAQKPGTDTSTRLESANTMSLRRMDNGKWACNHACKDKTRYALSSKLGANLII